MLESTQTYACVYIDTNSQTCTRLILDHTYMCEYLHTTFFASSMCTHVWQYTHTFMEYDIYAHVHEYTGTFTIHTKAYTHARQAGKHTRNL